MHPHILVVDDDAPLRDLLSRYLGEQGFAVTLAADAGKARDLLALFAFDLLVLDNMMPDETGLDFMTRRLQNNEAVPPVLFLTAMGEAPDRIAGLEAGADDYLPKPFEPKELVLRIRRILARTAEQKKKARIVQFGEFSFELDSGRLSQKGEAVYLTQSEAALMKSLAEHLGTPVAREALAAACGLSGDNERAVDVQITRLRKKIESAGRPLYLQTVRNEGYVLVGG